MYPRWTRSWGCRRRNIRYPAVPASDQCAGRVVWCDWRCLGAPPPPITIVGGCKTDDSESHGGLSESPACCPALQVGEEIVLPGYFQVPLAPPRTQATGVASRAAPTSSATPPSLYAPSLVMRGAGASSHHARPVAPNSTPLPREPPETVYSGGERLIPGQSRLDDGDARFCCGQEVVDG